jgi:murein DD-endopeptidase MepM/ murein hydrolase activator NlpD
MIFLALLRRWFAKRRRSSLIALLLSALLLGLLAQPSPAAINVQISPSSPQLGDTLSVVVPMPATVSMRGKDYPAFALNNSGSYRTLLPTTPLDRPGNLTIQVATAAERNSFAVSLRDRSFPTQRITLPPGQDGNVSDAEYNRVDAFKQIVTPDKLWNGPFLRPNNGEITTIFGVRRYYNGEFAQDYYHRGVDYAGNTGSAIIAPADGRVALVGYEKDGFEVHGNCVGLDHGQGVTSIYLHMTAIKVKPGDFVRAGQTIGTLGSTGAATGPHLHWGLFVQGKAVDPVPWREIGFE